MSPMPKPHEEEDHDTFMQRCMSDGMMQEEAPDEKQRSAICEVQWNKMHKEGDKVEGRYHHILSFAVSAIWAILPTKLAAIMDLLAFRASGGRLTSEEVQMQIGAVSRPQQRNANAIAVLPLYGTIIPRGNMLMESSGATSVEHFTQQFRQAMADPQIGAVLIDVDSPGGVVQGVDELATEIYRARGVKPVAAIAQNLAASAAYWIATAADEFYATPSAELGSIGVLAVHEDISRLLEKKGVNVSVIHSSKYKTEGSPYAPLGEEARAHIKSRVDEYHADFIAAVARGRNVPASEVEERYGQGRVVGARQAKALGMIDGVMTFDELVQHMAGRMKQKGPKAEGAPMTIDAALHDGLNPIIVMPDGVLGPTKADKDRLEEGIVAETMVNDLDLRRRRLKLAGE